MKRKRTIIIIALAALAGSVHAQSSVGGPRKPSQIGGPKAITNPVVAAQRGAQATAPGTSPGRGLKSK
jgi:hypothetical protein